MAKTASGYEQLANRSTSQSTGATGNRSSADSPTSTAPLPNCPQGNRIVFFGSTGLVQLVSNALSAPGGVRPGRWRGRVPNAEERRDSRRVLQMSRDTG